MKYFLFIFLLIFTLFGGASLVMADVNNFSISQFEIEYFLDKDNEGHSTLRVIERITADFPTFPQNKGLVREIPYQYDGHSLSFSLVSLKRNGLPEPVYAEYSQGDYRIIETGTDEYLLGPQTYTITYNLRDVTKYFPDTNQDEFYWDTNGTGWRVPIENLNIQINIAESLIPSLTGSVACYRGASGGTETCTLSPIFHGLTASTTNLLPYENLTVAVGFNPETFASYKPSLIEKILATFSSSLIQFTTHITGVLIIFWALFFYFKSHNRNKELGAIVPEYLPPEGVSTITSASLLNSTHSILTALLLDLAVRDYIKIIEVKEKTFLKKAEYEIEIKNDLNNLFEEEKEMLSDMFDGIPQKGQRLALKSLHKNISFRKRISDNKKKLDALLVTRYELRRIDEFKSKKLKYGALGLVVCGALSLNFVFLIMAITLYGASKHLKPLTDKGLVLRRYLKGFKEYISMAETERMRVLQSPTGAEKVGIDTRDTAKLIKLYERVLPYAVLFNKEKEWNKELGHYYEITHSRPSWYSNHNQTINTVTFASMMSSFSSSVSANSSYGSSSGGSGGGGFSGGGGGGGGGGGR